MDLTIVIYSCDKFSDLWDAHVNLLNQNWPNRTIRTIIVTDLPSSLSFENVEIIAAGEQTEMSNRVKFISSLITTKYVLLTLDDYFVIKKVDEHEIDQMLEVMENDGIDYLRLYKIPMSKKQYKDSKNLKVVDTLHTYRVNLYPGLWKNEILAKTVRENLNAWKYEVSLTKIMHEMAAKCLMSTGDEFFILDVVRKGKILPKAYRYLKRHDLYHGNRPKIKASEYYFICFKQKLKEFLPRKLIRFLKRIAIKLGFKFYSD